MTNFSDEAQSAVRAEPERMQQETPMTVVEKARLKARQSANLARGLQAQKPAPKPASPKSPAITAATFSKTPWWLIPLSIVVQVIMHPNLFNYLKNQTPAEKQYAACHLASPAEVEVAAEYVAENEVIARLRAPSTAKFPGIFDNGIYDGLTDDCVVWMNGWVDAQNAFGAMVRTNWHAQFTGTGTNLILTDLKLDE